METIRRYPIPPDSFAPDRPLNDLLRAQLEHFQTVEKRLPREFRPSLNPNAPEALAQDAPASNRYIATMTTLIRERRAVQLAKDQPAKPAPVLVSKPATYSPLAGLAIAASDAAGPATKSKKATPYKPKSRKP